MGGGAWHRPGRLAAAGLLSVSLAVAACGGKSETGSTPAAQGSGQRPETETSTAAEKPETNLIPKPPAPDPYSTQAGDSTTALVTSVRSYVSAIDRRDGRRLCSLFVSGGLRGIALPRTGTGCAARVGASIGYASGRGSWRRSRVRRVERVEIDPSHPADARVRALMVHTFRGGREPSIEDDLIYLRRSRGRWLVVKPSATFYRAIDAGDVPLRAITPPPPAR